MELARRSLVAGGAATLLAACTRVSTPIGLAAAPPFRLPPLHFDRTRLMRVTVCLRPFRPAGPRLEIENFGDKTVLHNYGHGGSGWSLSWGCAEEAVVLARQTAATRFAVIGAGVVGMTTALRLIETGAAVTIYASEFTPDTRSARATGVWSPSSRVGLTDQIGETFPNRWERWARRAFAVHQQMIGLSGDPVEFLQQYGVGGGEEPRVEPKHDFAGLDYRIRDIVPRWETPAAAEDPFPGRTFRSGQQMVFNVSEYADRLTRLFLLRGGRMVRRDFPDRAAVLALDEPVICNCMGFGAKAIWNDESMVPVRGQINWLTPQPEARYGLLYDKVQAISRHDGVVVQYLGPNDDWGYGDDHETIDPAETDLALRRMQGVFA